MTSRDDSTAELTAKTVMIVDDDLEMNKLLTVILKNDGRKVITAMGGQEALDLINRGATPDLILTDLRMPGMEGSELVRKLRENPKMSHIPVILTSGLEDIKALAGKTGASDFLSKPVQIMSFLAMIHQYIH